MNRKTTYPLLILVITLFCFSESQARTPNSDSVRYHFNPVVVTATKVASAQRDLAASITVIQGPRLEMAETSSVLELVAKQTPGVFLTQKGIMGYGVASGAAGGLTVRGLGGSPVTQVLVLIDGRPDIMGMMGHPIPDAYELDGIERIEVVRGPASFLYGTNAMGGVVNIIPRRLTSNGFETSASVSYGSFDTRKLIARHGGRIGSFDYYLTASDKHTDGHRANSQYDGQHYSGRMSYRISETGRLTLNSNYAQFKLYDPGTIDAPVQDHWYNIERWGADLTYEQKSRLGESYIKLHGNFGNHAIYDGWRSNDHTIGTMLYHNFKPWLGSTATIGFDIKQYGGHGENIIRGKDFGEHWITEYAPYVHLQQLLFGKAIASAGIRQEHHQIYGDELLPKFGLVYRLFKSTNLRASISKGFRSPTIRELYLFPAPTPNLQPERLWSYEAGIEHQISKQLLIDFAAFRSKGENLIRLHGNWSNFSLKNSGSFDHQGVEVTAKYNPTDRLFASTSISVMDTGDETRATPGTMVSASLSYSWYKIILLADAVHVRGLYGSDFHKDKLDNYTLADIRLGANLIKGLRLSILVRNALDETYQTMLGFPMPGRTLETELHYSF